MRVLFLSRYGRLGASSRVRGYQYAAYLQGAGIEVTAAPLFDDDYLERLYCHGSRSARTIVRAALRRLRRLCLSHRYDLLWIESELLPWAPALAETWLSATGQRFVLELDDAVFHRYDQHPSSTVRRLLGRKIDGLMRRAAVVIVGNDYLADRAASAGAARIERLPSVVDLEHYPIAERRSEEPFTIGWIGSPATAGYLLAVAPALRAVCADGDARVRLIGAPSSLELCGFEVERRPWDEAREAEEISGFDVGIMPLPDGPWERGKCGYKLIQYMACGRAVVASPVGANRDIVQPGRSGLWASSLDEWVAALRALRANAAERTAMGRHGRRIVEARYCLQVTAPRLASILREIAPAAVWPLPDLASCRHGRLASFSPFRPSSTR